MGTTLHEFCGPLVVAAAALLAVLLTLDAAGDYPSLLPGPGVTLDESFNVQMGVYQVTALKQYGLGILDFQSIREIFGPDTVYNPDHPPLGRMWLGVCHELTRWLFPPAHNDGLFVTDCARVGSATAFALTVLFVGVVTTNWFGRLAGTVAAASLVMMPRVFAHAHLASLETFMNLTYSACVLGVAHWWSWQPYRKGAAVNEPGSSLTATRHQWVVSALTGVLLGLALLSKIQAILIPPVVGLWALWHWRHRAIGPLVVFGFVGVIVFFVGWPWLWLEPLKHFRDYFARTTSRAVLHCYYWGDVWSDKDVPWHYPFVMFAATVPIGLHALALLGVWGDERGWRQPRLQLVLAAALFPLVLFALPKVAVYDGERLFLVSYPMWAVLCGHGATVAWDCLKKQADANPGKALTARLRAGCLVAFLAAQAAAFSVTHPCQLSYYNVLVGGAWGAERLGFERTYWGDSLTRDFLKQVSAAVPEGATIAVAPVLHQFQLDELLKQSPVLRERRIRLVVADPRQFEQGHWPRGVNALLTFARKADLATVFQSDSDSLHVAAEWPPHSGRRWLARLVLPDAALSDVRSRVFAAGVDACF